MSSGSVSVSCTLVDENNGNEFTQALTKSPGRRNEEGPLLLARDVAIANGKDSPDNWYLKKVEYVIPEIPASTMLYGVTSHDNVYSGNYYGRIRETASSTISVSHMVNGTWTPVSGTPASSTTTLATSAINTLCLGDKVIITDEEGNSAKTSESDLSVTAGSQVMLTAELRMYQLPYSSSQYAAAPELTLVSPRGVSVANVSAVWVGKTGTIVPTLSYELLPSGQTLYRVRFAGTAGFGGPQIIDGVMKFPSVLSDSSPYPCITLTLNTAYGMDDTQIQLIDSLFIRDENDATSSNAYYQKRDTYDLDGDGNTAEFISGLHNMSNRQSITITPNTKQLTFSSQAKMADEPDSSYRNGTTAANRLYLSDTTDRVNYRLTIGNTSGSIVPAGNFMYYMPIPKRSIAAYHRFNGAPGFDLALTGAISVTGNNPSIYSVRYSIDATDGNYNNGMANFESVDANGVTKASWLTAAQVGGNWANVTMIKIIGADPINGYIPTDTSDYFTLTLLCSDEILTNVGESTSWGCCGVQKYVSDGTLNVNGIHTPTEYVTVMLRHEESHTMTLTAASGMTPTHPSIRTDSFLLPAYVTDKSIDILSVRTENTVLHSSATILANAETASGATANSSFGITALLTGGSPCELSAGTGQTLGTTTANVAATVTVALYNYDSLSDISTPRQVTLVLGDNEGIQITVVIIIARERATVDDVRVHIESGKVYQIMHGNASSVIVTNDSALTSQYVRTYIPANYTAHTLSLLQNGVAADFPQNTKLTLINLTDPDSPGYFYYIFDIAASHVPLVAFVSMYDGVTPYNDPASGNSTSRVEDETLLLITDFSDTDMPLVPDSYTILLSLTGATGTSDFDIGLTMTLSSARVFSLSAETSAVPAYNSLTVTGTASTAAGSASDSRWLYRKMSLVVTLNDPYGNTIPFPNGMIVTMGESNFIPTGTKVILPLGSLGTYDYSYTIATPHTQITAGTYNVNTALYVSSTASAENPMGGDLIDTKYVSVTVLRKPQYALDVDTSDGNRLISLSEENTVSLNLNLSYNEATANAAVTLEIQEKVDNIYLTSNTIIEGATAGGQNYVVNGYGIITLPTRSYGTGMLEVTLLLDRRDLIVGHTYRINIKAIGIGEVAESVCNFIIIR